MPKKTLVRQVRKGSPEYWAIMAENNNKMTGEMLNEVSQKSAEMKADLSDGLCKLTVGQLEMTKQLGGFSERLTRVETSLNGDGNGARGLVGDIAKIHVKLDAIEEREHARELMTADQAAFNRGMKDREDIQRERKFKKQDFIAVAVAAPIIGFILALIAELAHIHF